MRAVWSAGRYTLYARDGGGWELADDEYGQDLTRQDLVDLGNALIDELAPALLIAEIELAQGERTVIELDPEQLRRMFDAGEQFLTQLNRLLKKPPVRRRRRGR